MLAGCTLALVRVGIERRYQADIQGIQDRAYQIVSADQIWRALTGLLNLAWSLVIFISAYAYLNYVFPLFPWTRGLSKGLLATVMNPIWTMGAGLVGIIPDLAFLTVLILATRFALKLMRAFFEGIARETVKLKGFDTDWALADLLGGAAPHHRFRRGGCVSVCARIKIRGVQRSFTVFRDCVFRWAHHRSLEISSPVTA